jgi:VCBS repeat-containing protein
VTFTDVDLIDTHGVTVTGVSVSGTKAGLPDDKTVLSWLLLGDFTDSTGDGTGSQAWSFSAKDHYFDYLTADEHVTLAYTVQVSDGHGGVVSQQVTVTIEGSAEPAAPVVDLNDDTSGLNNVIHVSADSTSPVLIAPDPEITDTDSTNLQSMTVTLTNPQDNSSSPGSNGVNVKETLTLTDQAATLAAGDGLTVTVSTPQNMSDPITLTITGSASVADYQAILEGVRYTDTKSGHHDGTDRVITVVVNDGTQNSSVQTTTITNSHVINGTDAANTLISTSANDYMTGAGGADNFKFSPHLGNDTVADFTPGTDAITFASGMFGNHPADVLAATHDDGSGNTVITIDAHNSITLHNVQKAQLSASDFHFV